MFYSYFWADDQFYLFFYGNPMINRKPVYEYIEILEILDKDTRKFKEKSS